jgi:cell division protein ZapA (FtsZ GTPase activity inhibitor)
LGHDSLQERAEEVHLKEHESSRTIELNTGTGDSAEAVNITLFGHEYDIRGYGNSKEVQKIAAFITQRAEGIKKNVSVASTLDLAVLTLLNITNEMFQHKHAKEVTIKKLEEKTDRLLKAIDKIV